MGNIVPIVSAFQEPCKNVQIILLCDFGYPVKCFCVQRNRLLFGFLRNISGEKTLRETKDVAEFCLCFPGKVVERLQIDGNIIAGRSLYQTDFCHMSFPPGKNQQIFSCRSAYFR